MSDAPIFFRRTDTLSLEDARYYQDLFYRVIKIGTEIEFAMPKGVYRKDFQPMIEALMQPSHDMERLGKLGVYDVIKEHSGIEVQVIGRHPYWDSLLKQYRRILTALLARGVRMRPTCGLHYHMLSIGLAETVPEIILANLWNLTRKHALGLKFLTCGGENREALCRRRQHNAHQEFIRQSPANKSMSEIQATLKDSLIVPEHQNFFNLEHMQFDEKGDISKFHVEFRFPDGDFSPISVTAKTFLFFYLLLKAVEISKFGLIHVGKVFQYNRNKELLDLLSNNDGPLATSDTTGFSDEMIDYCRDRALAMLRELKSIFIILDNPSELILLELAQKPIGLRRSEGDSWEKIDRDLEALLADRRHMDELDYRITKIIELCLIQGLHDPNEWYRQAAVTVGASKEKLQERLQGYRHREPRWDWEVGSMVFGK